MSALQFVGIERPLCYISVSVIVCVCELDCSSLSWMQVLLVTMTLTSRLLVEQYQ